MGKMPDNYFEIRKAIEEAPVVEGFGELIRLACMALDAWDWPQLRQLAERALRRPMCPPWRRRLELLLSDPVIRDSVSG